MRKGSSARLAASALFFSTLLAAPMAFATGPYDFPDTGTEPFGRGGAWVARASDPLATFQNPAALATQKSGVTLDVHLIFQKTCFQRVGPGGQAEQTAGGGPTLTYPTETCNENASTPFPNPTLAATWRVSQKLGLGFYVGGPNAAGNVKWPDSVKGTNAAGRSVDVPSPTRYMLLEQQGLVVLPTLSAGYEVLPNLQVGAGFVWGIASFTFANISQALGSQAKSDDFSSDIKATLKVKDLFFPGVVAGVLYEPLDNLDIGGWYSYQSDIHASGDAYIEGLYYTPSGAVNPPSKYLGNLDTRDLGGNRADVTLHNPMQARVGFRFHQPREGAAPAAPEVAPNGSPTFRDPIANDVFDAEIDFTWSHNSVVKDLEIRFNGDPIYIPWLAGGLVPPNADVPHHFKDVFGVRAGGDVVILPNRLSVRAGGFVESNGQDPTYANIDFVPSARFGLTAGGTFRLIDKLDLMLAAGHMFTAKLDNGGNGGLRALAGSAATTPTTFRSQFIMNNGSVTQQTSVISLGATYHF